MLPNRSRLRAFTLCAALSSFGLALLPLDSLAQEHAPAPTSNAAESASGTVTLPTAATIGSGPITTFHLEDDLTLGPGNWTAGLANYPAEFDPSEHYRFQTGWVPPLALLGPGAGGVGVRARNDGGSFQGSYPLAYLKRSVDGLEPNTFYLVTFERVQIGTMAAFLFGATNFAIGPDPFRLVGRVEVAASTQEPSVIERFEPSYGRTYRELSVREHKVYMPPAPDDTNPALRPGGLSGTAAAHLGILAQRLGPDEISILDFYGFIDLSGADRPLCVKTDGAGRCWLLVGNELNHDGITDGIYRRVAVTLRPVRQLRPVARLFLVETPTTPGHPLSVRYTLLNAQDQPLGLSFGSAQIALVQIKDGSGAVVATNDLLGLNLPVAPAYVLAPGERFAFKASVPTDALLPGQNYTVEALPIGYDQYVKRTEFRFSE